MNRMFLALALLSAQPTFAATDVLFSPHGGVKSTVAQELLQAKRRVDVAMYSFSDKELQSALKATAARGVKVRLILEGAEKRAALATDFENSGIDVKYVVPVMHHKFAIIDGKGETVEETTIISGSANWSSSSDTEYDEDFLVMKGEQTKNDAFQGEFDFIWTHARDFAGAASGGEREEPSERFHDESTYFTSQNFEVVQRGENWVFRPVVEAQEGVAGSAIVKAIDEAQQEVLVATTHLRRGDMYHAMKRALARGVKVSLILDQQEFKGKPTQAALETDVYYEELLAGEGADVRYKLYMAVWNAARAKQMHSKYLVVDRKLVLSGSFNWSKNSEIGSLENLNRIEGEIVQKYVENFDVVFTRGGETGFSALLEEVKTLEGQGPCAFEPVSVTYGQMFEFRSALRGGACRRQ